MAFWNFWQSKKSGNDGLRIIKTLLGQRSIDNAIANGTNLIIKNVEPFSTVEGKYCVLKK